MSNKLVRPTRGTVYTFEQICNLYLRDSPHLKFIHNNIEGVVQTSHVTEEELLRNEKFKNSKWRYIRETDEWIPIFVYSEENSQDITEIADLTISQYGRQYSNNDYWWATPKDHPRPEQE